MRKETAAATRARDNFTIVKYSRTPRIQPLRNQAMVRTQKMWIVRGAKKTFKNIVQDPRYIN